MIARPIQSRSLHEIIYDIMQCGNFILLTPGGFPIVIDSSVLEELTDGMIEAIGSPKIAASCESLSDLLIKYQRDAYLGTLP